MKKQYSVEKTLAINARPSDIFNVLTHLEQWNQWTQSISEMSILNEVVPGLGARVKVLQPKLPPAIWTITEIKQDKSFTWEKESVGLKMISEHLILSVANETSVTIRMTYEGFLANLFYKLTHSLTDRYMTMEINGLKKECEKSAPPL